MRSRCCRPLHLPSSITVPAVHSNRSAAPPPEFFGLIGSQPPVQGCGLAVELSGALFQGHALLLHADHACLDGLCASLTPHLTVKCKPGAHSRPGCSDQHVVRYCRWLPNTSLAATSCAEHDAAAVRLSLPCTAWSEQGGSTTRGSGHLLQLVVHSVVNEQGVGTTRGL